MSDTPNSPTDWQASDGKWYPQAAAQQPSPPPPPGPFAPQQPNQFVPQAPAQNQQPPPGQFAPPPQKKSNKGCLIAAIVVLVLLVAGVGGCLVVGGKAVQEVKDKYDQEVNRTGVGSQDDPAPVGTEVDLGSGWKMKVVTTNFDATEEVAAANEYNPKPATGKKYVIVTYRAEYSGSSSADFLGYPELIGSKKIASSWAATCIMPTSYKQLEGYANVANGAVLEGSLCYEVDTADSNLLAKAGQGIKEPAYFKLQ